MMRCGVTRPVGRRRAGRRLWRLCAAEFDTGEAYKFGWSYEILKLGFVAKTVKVSNVSLNHSRLLFVRS